MTLLSREHMRSPVFGDEREGVDICHLGKFIRHMHRYYSPDISRKLVIECPNTPINFTYGMCEFNRKKKFDFDNVEMYFVDKNTLCVADPEKKYSNHFQYDRAFNLDDYGDCYKLSLVHDEFGWMPSGAMEIVIPKSCDAYYLTRLFR